MLVSVVTIKLQPEAEKSLAFEIARTKIRQILERSDGFIRSYSAIQSQSNHFIFISLWASEAELVDARENADFQYAYNEIKKFFITLPVIERYELIDQSNPG
jgi:quinol monooxygenase YgiN